MARLGQSGKELFKLLEELKAHKVNLSGLLMHFASTEDFTEHSYSMLQLKTFQENIKFAEKQGFSNVIRHAASSASTMLFKEARFDMSEFLSTDSGLVLRQGFLFLSWGKILLT